MIAVAVILRRYSNFSYYDVFGIRNQFTTLIRVFPFSIFVVLIIDILLSMFGRRDLLFVWSISIVGGTVGVSYVEVFYVINQNKKHSSNTSTINSTSVDNSATAVSTCICCKQSLRIEHTMKNIRKHISDHKKQHDGSTRARMGSKTKSESGNQDTANFNYISSIKIMRHWSQVVSTSMGYELFMNHLEKEFSVETLLFITEVCIYSDTRSMLILYCFHVEFFEF